MFRISSCPCSVLTWMSLLPFLQPEKLRLREACLGSGSPPFVLTCFYSLALRLLVCHSVLFQAQIPFVPMISIRNQKVHPSLWALLRNFLVILSLTPGCRCYLFRHMRGIFLSNCSNMFSLITSQRPSWLDLSHRNAGGTFVPIFFIFLF